MGHERPRPQRLPQRRRAVLHPARHGGHAGAPGCSRSRRAILVGHSVGGYLSLRFRLLHPQRVRGLVLVACAPGFRRDDRRQEWNRYCHARARAYDERGLAENPNSDEVVIAGHRDATGLARAARGILTQEDARVIDGLPEMMSRRWGSPVATMFTTATTSYRRSSTCRRRSRVHNRRSSRAPATRRT